ncbi:MAG: hypothetical protein JXB20_04100, partial [Bacilli bacterium]|nr:hypothetical protein [Bacilli bacterium]
MANILIRKGLLYFLGICITIFVLTFITSGFIRVNVENMGGNSYYPSYPLYEAYADENIVQSISMTDYLADNDITPALDAKGYDGSVLDWHGEMPDTLSFLIDVPVAGTYSLALDFLSSTESVKPNEITVLINDELQTDSAENMQLLPRWATETEEVRFDSYHNQILARHESADHWSTIQLRDQLFLDVEPVTFDFVAGINEITITREQGEFLLGNIHIVEPDELKAYTEYRTLYGPVDTNAVSLVLEAEEYTYKNSIAILPGIEKSPSVSPFSSENNYMNIIASSFSDTGNRLTYAFEVETEGDYEITLKYKNDTYSNRASFRNIYIDDQIPFAELADYKFEYASKWTNETLGDEEGTYKIHLDQGVHYLALEASSGVFADDYRRILEIIDEISEYSLELKRLTGGESDVNREWDIESFLPDTSEMLSVWNDDLESIY